MNKIRTKLPKIAVLLMMVLSLSLLAPAPAAQAADAGQILAYGALAYIMLDAQLQNIDQQQMAVLNVRKSQTGVEQDPVVIQRFVDVVTKLEGANKLKYNSMVYPTPDRTLNGFCGPAHVIAINRGAFDHLTDDEVAYLIAHEYGHSENNHINKGLRAKVAVGLLVDLYLSKNQNYVSQWFGNVAANLYSAEVTSIAMEWEADNAAFAYATTARFNPGGGAAHMFRARAMYGDGYTNELGLRIKGYNNHPPTSERIANYHRLLTEYSGGHVTVRGDKTVIVDNLEVITPTGTKTRLAGERAYLIAGNLARVFHDNALDTATIAEDGDVCIGKYRIMTPLPGDPPAEEIVYRINEITGK